MKLQLLKGTPSFITEIFIQDSSSTTGAGLAGVAAASAGLIVGYMRPGATAYVVATPVDVLILGTFTPAKDSTWSPRSASPEVRPTSAPTLP